MAYFHYRADKDISVPYQNEDGEGIELPLARVVRTYCAEYGVGFRTIRDELDHSIIPLDDAPHFEVSAHRDQDRPILTIGEVDVTLPSTRRQWSIEDVVNVCESIHHLMRM